MPADPVSVLKEFALEIHKLAYIGYGTENQLLGVAARMNASAADFERVAAQKRVI
jgi:hypothetical protein